MAVILASGPTVDNEGPDCRGLEALGHEGAAPSGQSLGLKRNLRIVQPLLGGLVKFHSIGAVFGGDVAEPTLIGGGGPGRGFLVLQQVEEVGNSTLELLVYGVGGDAG